MAFFWLINVGDPNYLLAGMILQARGYIFGVWLMVPRKANKTWQFCEKSEPNSTGWWVKCSVSQTQRLSLGDLKNQFPGYMWQCWFSELPNNHQSMKMYLLLKRWFSSYIAICLRFGLLGGYPNFFLFQTKKRLKKPIQQAMRPKTAPGEVQLCRCRWSGSLELSLGVVWRKGAIWRMGSQLPNCLTIGGGCLGKFCSPKSWGNFFRNLTSIFFRWVGSTTN